jgi:predicted HD phosphohydrolase
VSAKRYLCATDPTYFEKLSPASVHTLNLQGGPMGHEDVNAFQATPYLDEILRVRIWDEGSKVAGRPTPTFEHYAPILQRVVDAHSAG